MSERHRDPLELWVGTWTPEEWIKRENRKREEAASEDPSMPASVKADGPPPSESG